MKERTKLIAYTGVLTALCVITTLYISVPTIGGHTNLCDVVIYLAASILGPIPALIVGGVGTFIADIIAYPLTAGFSLVFHGLEGLVAGLLLIWVKNKSKAKAWLGLASFVVAGIIVIVGFFFAKAFVYGTMETALVSLWRNVLQIAISAVLATILLYPLKLQELLSVKKKN